MLGERVDTLEAALKELAQAQIRTEKELHALAEAQARTEARVEALIVRVEALAEAQARTEARLEALAEAQARTEARVEALIVRLEALAEAQVRTEQELRALTVQVGSLAGIVGTLQGENLERRYRERPFLYFRRLLSEPRVLSEQDVLAIIGAGLSDEELDELLAADIIITGRRPDGTAAYLLAEVSQTVRLYDVERAVARAHLLARTTAAPVLPVVAGRYIREAADEAAYRQGVWRVLDKRTYAPDQLAAREQVAGDE